MKKLITGLAMILALEGCNMKEEIQIAAKADFNRDGVEDVLFYDSVGSLYLMNGISMKGCASELRSNKNNAVLEYPFLENPYSVVHHYAKRDIEDLEVTDIDDNGSVDITYKYLGKTEVLLNKGNGAFQTPNRDKIVWMKGYKR